MLVPLTPDYVWQWIERWQRRLDTSGWTLEPWPGDWREYERRWREQWELDILDHLERQVMDTIDILDDEIRRLKWQLDWEWDNQRTLTRVPGTDQYTKGETGSPRSAKETQSMQKKLDDMKAELDKYKKVLDQLEKIRGGIEGLKLRPDEATTL